MKSSGKVHIICTIILLTLTVLYANRNVIYAQYIPRLQWRCQWQCRPLTHYKNIFSPSKLLVLLLGKKHFFSIFKKVVFLSHLSMNLRSDAIFDTHTFKHWFAEKLQFSFFFFFPFFQLPTSKVHYICPFHANNSFSSFGLIYHYIQ